MNETEVQRENREDRITVVLDNSQRELEECWNNLNQISIQIQKITNRVNNAIRMIETAEQLRGIKQ